MRRRVCTTNEVSTDATRADSVSTLSSTNGSVTRCKNTDVQEHSLKQERADARLTAPGLSGASGVRLRPCVGRLYLCSTISLQVPVIRPHVWFGIKIPARENKINKTRRNSQIKRK